jgi:tRNA nucleotidyltransferase/poly(A) polymerase
MKLADLFKLITQTEQQASLSTPYLVGGMVRDIYLKRFNAIKDIDLTCGDKTSDALGQKMLEKLPSATYTKFGDGHGRLTFGSFNIDFSSNYNVPNIDGELRKLGVNRANSLEREMFSRDFTVNALLMPLDMSRIIDVTGRGIADLNRKQIETCLAPEVTLANDPRRIVRIVYLCSKLSFAPSQRIVDWVNKNKQAVASVDKQYAKDKLNKAIEVNPKFAFELLDKLGMKGFVPESETSRNFLAEQPELLLRMLTNERTR